MNDWLIGIDSGGTFTDLIAYQSATGEVRVIKVPSDPAHPDAAVMRALKELFGSGVAPAEIRFLAHGTTVATNALLEAKGVRTGLLITRGFRAVYEARGWTPPENKRDLVDPFFEKPPLLAPQSLTGEIDERIAFDGSVLKPLDEAQARQAVRRLVSAGVESIAICFLFGFLNPAHEERVTAMVAEEAPGVRCSISSHALPTIREYPRLSTTVVDAYVGPVIERYLTRLSRRLNEGGVNTRQIFLMQSNGGLMRMNLAASYPTQTLLSGPAAGMTAGIALARSADESHLVTFDMGGTSTDIGVIVAGRAEQTSDGRLGGQDIGIPMLRIRTLGAGGGTLARIGKDGLLKVGPESAGAIPGPACYGRGGTEATLTDANLMLGVLGANSLLGGRMTLDLDRARAAIGGLADRLGLGLLETAAGIVRIVNNQMAINVRLALEEQGQDARRFALVAFGGAGPIHAAVLAAELHIPRVIVPPYPGLNSAMGLLQTEVRHTYVRSAVGSLGAFPLERINAVFAELQQRARDDARAEGFAEDALRLSYQADLRYPHQGYQLTVPCPGYPLAESAKQELRRAFDSLHQTLYGQRGESEDAELVTLRLMSEATVPRFERQRAAESRAASAADALTGERQLYDPASGSIAAARVYDRVRMAPGARVIGPAIIEQFDATTLVPAERAATSDGFGNLIIEATGDET